jgi:2Fe-2S ferredoxin
MKLIVKQADGTTTDVPARLNWTVMELIKDAGLPMRAECGGSCACATCHVYVDPEWMGKVGERNDEEAYTLDGAFNVEPNSRLSCQITFKPELDGLTMTLSKDATG